MRYPYEMDRRQFRTVLAVFLCTFISMYTYMMASSTLKFFQETFHIDYSYVMWLSIIIPITSISFYFIVIELSNKIGKNTTLICGLVIVFVSSLLAVFSDKFYPMLICRMISGIGSAMILTSTISILVDNTKEEYRSEVLSLNYVASSFGAIVGPILAYLITASFGWQVMFISILPFCALGIYAVSGNENIKSSDTERKIPYILHLMYLAGSFVLLMGLFKPGDTMVLTIIGAVILAVFFILNRRSENKLIHSEKLKGNKIFIFSLIMALLFYVITYAIANSANTFLQIFDKEMIVFGAITVGMLAAILNSAKPIIQTVLTPVIFRIFRKNSAGLPMVGTILLIITFIIIVVSNDNDVFEVCVVAIVTVAIASSLFVPGNTSYMFSTVDKEDRNAVSAIFNIVHDIGRIFGMMILISALTIFGVKTTLESFMGANGILLMIVMVLCAIIVVMEIISFRRRKKEKNESE